MNLNSDNNLPAALGSLKLTKPYLNTISGVSLDIGIALSFNAKD